MICAIARCDASLLGISIVHAHGKVRDERAATLMPGCGQIIQPPKNAPWQGDVGPLDAVVEQVWIQFDDSQGPSFINWQAAHIVERRGWRNGVAGIQSRIDPGCCGFFGCLQGFV